MEEQEGMLVIVDEIMYSVEKGQLIDYSTDCWLRFEEVEYNHL